MKVDLQRNLITSQVQIDLFLLEKNCENLLF